MFNFILSITKPEYNNYFHALASNQIKIIQINSQILGFTTKILASASSLLKMSICSYFLFNFISFENLSLFYIFLNIKSVPIFVRLIYNKLLSILLV